MSKKKIHPLAVFMKGKISYIDQNYFLYQAVYILFSTVKLGILTWRVYGTDSLLEPASSGQSMNCSFKKLKKQKVVILRYYKHSMYNQCLYQTTFCWHNADMHDSTDIHRNNTVGMQYNTNIRKKTQIK